MKLKELSKTIKFVKYFKQEYDYLKVGECMSYSCDSFDIGSYSISIFTGVSALDSDIVNVITEFLNQHNFFWFFGACSDGIFIHVH